MKSIGLAITFTFLALLIYVFWLAGSHGNVRFRYWMTEDWILTILLLSCISVPVIIFLKWIKKKT